MPAMCLERGALIAIILSIGAVCVYHFYTERQRQKRWRHQERESRSTEIIRSKPSVKIVDGMLPVDVRDDAVAASDYRKIVDPLTEPGRRISRDQIPPEFVAQWLNIPTQPWDDSPSPIGYLYQDPPESDDAKQKNFFQLMARRDRYRSTRYKYYVIVNGVKVDIRVRADELFDGDSVTIPGLSSNYKVKLYRNDGPYYDAYTV